MAALAKGEQVILSAQTAAALSPVLRARVREIDSLTVKGKHDRHRDLRADLAGIRRGPHVAGDAAGAAAGAHPAAPRHARDRARRRPPEPDARPRSAERRRDRRPHGVAGARADRAPPGQVRARRPELERHLRHRRGRARDPAAARGDDPARSRPRQLRSRVAGCPDEVLAFSCIDRDVAVSARGRATASRDRRRDDAQACRGSSASRRPSPTRLNDSTSTKIDTPGQTAIHGALSM